MLSKSRLFASALAVAGIGAVALGYSAPQLGKTWMAHGVLAQTVSGDAPRLDVAEARVRGDAPGTQVDTERDVRVDAPSTAVRVNKDSGKVAVRAPYTGVRVDPDKGQVRVRAPYVDLDIRW